MSDDAVVVPASVPDGLTSGEAAERLRHDGPNEAAEERRHPLIEFARHFWGPVPWMLELTVVLEIVLHRSGEGIVIAALLVFNAVVGRVQEGRARNALAMLRQRLQVQARTKRDGRWQLVPARELVVGDVVHLRMGDVAPADVTVGDGQLLVDQSALTGESLPVEVGPGKPAFAGTVMRRGEASGVVTATGVRTAFGKTAELVRLAKTKSHLETVIFAVVKALVILDAVLVTGVLVYAVATRQPMAEVLPFSLILLVASVPVALPATFTVATAIGATELVGEGVLVTRLAAIEEAAGMDVLCSDKTGTITRNELSVTALVAAAPCTEAELLRFACIASDESTQDPIDLAIVREARAHGVEAAPPAGRRFVPFDSATKRSEGIVPNGDSARRAVKGTPATVLPLAGPAGAALAAEVKRLGAQGARVLAVAEGDAEDGSTLRPVGLIGLADPPRPDAAELIGHLHDLGVRVAMVTGDAEPTALQVARQVGVGERVCPVEALRHGGAEVLEHDVFAGVLPEDKFHLVQAFQRHGHATGMTGDGVNDAPALKQAEVGVAVSNATDVAKAAASLVLTTPGLGNVVAAVRTSRRIYQRMVTYTLNKVIKTCEISLLLSLGLILAGTFVTTPTLIVLLLFTNDFVTMAIATDRTTVPAAPTRWRIGPLMRTALTLAALILLMSFSVFFAARNVLHLPLAQLQTLMFVLLVFSGQGTVYLVREHRHFWHSRPSGWLLGSSLADIVVVGAMAALGILMAPIPLWLLAATLVLVAAYLSVLDVIKVRLMRTV